MHISNKGNLWGPEPAFENALHYVTGVANQGIMVLVDFWLEPQGFFFGEHAPEFPVSFQIIKEYQKKLIFRAKNQLAIEYLSANHNNYHWFAQENDPYVLTNYGYVWVSNGAYAPNRVNYIVNAPGLASIPDDLSQVAGVCSDYIGLIVENK